mmetsp:Transcript_35740/g.83689  ORF Transcript_35740/g.83689 Transcript_35740/m.83689 type:complete len:777 (+) Transcript_35740:72-2402(+)
MAQFTNPMNFGEPAPPAPGGLYDQTPGPADAFQDPSALDDAYGDDPYGDDQEDPPVQPPPPSGPVLRSIDKETGISPRRCSDIIWCPIFTAFMIFLFIVAVVWERDENQERLRHGFDAQANLCGMDSDVKDAPYIYFCRKDPTAQGQPGSWRDIDLIRPACVSECPREGTAAVLCLQEAQNTAQESSAISSLGLTSTNIVKSSQSKVFTSPYNTSLRMGMQCLADNEDLREGMFRHNSAGTNWWYFRVAFGGLLRTWGVFAVVTICTMVLAYAFFFIYEACQGWLIKLLAAILSLGLLVVGIWFGMAIFVGGAAEWDWYMDEGNPFYARGDKWATAVFSLIFGLVCIALAIKVFNAVIFYSCGCFKKGGETLNMDRYFDLIRATAEGIRKNPFLVLLPFFTGWILYFVFWIFTWALCSMLSAGYTEKYRIFVNGVQFAGLSAMFYMEWWRWIFIALLIFGAFWALNYVMACHQYIITSVIMKWYYTPKVKHDGGPGHPLFQSAQDFEKPGNPKYFCDALIEAGFWHSGTMFISALWVGFWRIIWEVLFLPINMCDPHGETRNWDHSKDNHMDTVMRANDYNGAKEGTRFRMNYPSKVVASMKHGLRILSLMAALYSIVLAIVIAWLMVRNIDTFATPGSKNYVLSPVLISIWASILAVMVSYSVIALLDVGADALLGAYAWNKKFNKKTIDKFIPVSLRYCIGWEELKSDKYPYYGKADRNMYLNTFYNAGNPDENPGLVSQGANHAGSTFQSMKNFATSFTRGGDNTGGAGLGMS